MSDVKIVPIFIYFIVSGFINVVSQISQSVFTMVSDDNPIQSINWADFGQVQLFILIAGALANAMHSAYAKFTDSAGGDYTDKRIEQLSQKVKQQLVKDRSA